jgi:large subunit ribosomal protein L32
LLDGLSVSPYHSRNTVKAKFQEPNSNLKARLEIGPWKWFLERFMAVPKRRTSHARQGKRRSHQHLKPIQIQYCSQCNEPVLPHRVCPNCGYYQGREVVPEEEK